MGYERLLYAEAGRVAESQGKYLFITERHVQVMWLQQKYFVPLTTSDGEEIELLSPGIWNAEGGPDFKKAHLKIGGREYRGDVEIHLRDEGWYQHKHHLDRHYNQVVLHLSFWRPTAPKEIRDSLGRRIFSAYLENSTTIPLSRILQLIDLDLYPYKRFTGSGRCAEELFNRLSVERVENFFRDASLFRLEKKMRHLTLRAEEESLAAAVGIAMALGYRDNAEAFVELFHLLIPHRECEEKRLLSALMACCGFFSEHFCEKWGDSEYYRELAREEPIPSMQLSAPIALNLQKIRPVNHPIRRLFYLIKLVKDPSLRLFYHSIEGEWGRRWQSLKGEKSLKGFLEELSLLIPIYSDPYWNSHYTFERASKELFLPLIGDSVKREIAVNTLFPLLYISIAERGSPAEMNAFIRLYSSAKSAPTKKSRYLKHRFFGESAKRELLERSDMVQGAYQLHYDFCIHYEASCEGCPFVKRFKESFL